MESAGARAATVEGAIAYPGPCRGCLQPGKLQAQAGLILRGFAVGGTTSSGRLNVLRGEEPRPSVSERSAIGVARFRRLGHDLNGGAGDRMGLDELIARREELLRVARSHGAVRVRIFGSTARGTAGPASDMDFLVELAASQRGRLRGRAG